MAPARAAFASRARNSTRLCGARQSVQGVRHARLAVGEPGVGFKRHGKLRRGAGDLCGNQRLLQVAKPPGMGEPDIARTEGFAQMKQDRDFPQAAPVILAAKVALPF